MLNFTVTIVTIRKRLVGYFFLFNSIVFNSQRMRIIIIIMVCSTVFEKSFRRSFDETLAVIMKCSIKRKRRKFFFFRSFVESISNVFLSRQSFLVQTCNSYFCARCRSTSSSFIEFYKESIEVSKFFRQLSFIELRLI